MIVDSFAHAKIYEAACPGLADCLAEIQRLIETDAENGRYDANDGSYVAVSSYVTRIDPTPEYENHRDYIDVQVLASGCERLLAGDAESAERIRDYQPDAEFFAAPVAVQEIALRAGYFAVFFPGDAHAPGLALGDVPVAVKKLVGKIPVRKD